MYDGHMFGFGGGFMWIFWVLLIVAMCGQSRQQEGAEIIRLTTGSLHSTFLRSAMQGERSINRNSNKSEKSWKSDMG